MVPTKETNQAASQRGLATEAKEAASLSQEGDCVHLFLHVAPLSSEAPHFSNCFHM